MLLKQGEVYVCKEPKCGAKIEVKRGADAACEALFSPRCCCGREMVREVLPIVTAARTFAGTN